MATPRKATKRPTGELAKSNSKLAKFIAGGPNKLTPAQARTAAGLYRDMEKAAGKKGFSGMGALDRSGAALGKAIKQTKAQTARADKAKAAKTTSRGPKAGTAVASKIVKNLKSRAREVRDVPTSFANAISMWEANMGPNTKAGPQSGRMLKDIAKQSGEAARALLTGKKGTAPLKVTKNPKDKFYGAMTNREYIAKQAKPDNSRDGMKKMMRQSGKALTPAQKAKLKKMIDGRLNK